MQTITIRLAAPADISAIDDLLAADGRRREPADIARHIGNYTVMVNGGEMAAVLADGVVAVHPGYPERLACDSLKGLLTAAEARRNSSKEWKPICNKSVNSCIAAATEEHI